MFCIWEVKTIMFVLYQVYVWRTQCRVRQEAAIRWQRAVRSAAQVRSLPTCCSTYRTTTPRPQHPPIVFVWQDQWILRTSTVQSKADTSEAEPVHCCNRLPITWSGCCHWHIKKWQKKRWLCRAVSEHMARFCEHFTVDFRFGAECSKGISLEL